MVDVLYGAVAGFALILALLLVSIVVGRLLSDARRRRERIVRPEIETAIAGYLAGDDDELPELPTSEEARELFRSIALETLVELRGGERARLIELLERTGIVLDTALELCSRRKRVRRVAAEALAQMGSAEAARTLRVGIQDRDAEVRLSSAAGLAELADAEDTGEVLAVAEEFTEDRPGAAAAIVLTLGARAPATLAESLAPGASPELWRLCAAVVGELRLAEHAPLLRQALTSDDDELVSRAARGLGKIGDSESVDLLLGLTDDPERAWFVKLAATSALGSIGDPRAAPALERELESDNWVLQSKAAKALHLLGETGDAGLRRALASPADTVRAHAKAALAQ
jgi:HEAT repeat protein